MNIPVELLAVLLSAILAALGWCLVLLRSIGERLTRLETRFDCIDSRNQKTKYEKIES